MQAIGCFTILAGVICLIEFSRLGWWIPVFLIIIGLIMWLGDIASPSKEELKEIRRKRMEDEIDYEIEKEKLKKEKLERDQ